MTFPMNKSFFQNGILCLSLFLGLVGKGLAVDRYVLDVPRFVMVGDSEIFVTVTPLSEGEVDLSPHAISFLGLPSGVRIESLSGASSPLFATGATRFRVSLDSTLSPTRIVCRVQKVGDPDVRGTGFFIIENRVDHFQMTPAGMTAPQVGVPFPFQIVAMDSAGAIVRSYKSPVELVALFGSVQEPFLSGDLFNDGVALAEVLFSEADPPGRLNQLKVSAARLYPGQREKATGIVELTVGAKAQ